MKADIKSLLSRLRGDDYKTESENVHSFEEARARLNDAGEEQEDARSIQSWLKAKLQRFEERSEEELEQAGLPAVPESGGDPAEATEQQKSTKLLRPLDLEKIIAKEVRRGAVAIGAFMIFALGWSALAPISSAAIAPGVISPVGARKTVQHLEGGIIERILVQDGSEVKAGDPLILLEDTMARASYELIRTQYYTRAAQQARLLALQSGAPHVAFPDWLLAKARDPETFKILDTQRKLLATQRQAHEDRKAVLSKKLEQLQQEIVGLESQIEGQTKQLGLIQKEISGVQSLVNKGLERTPRLLSLQRTEAEIKAARGANQAHIARTEQAMGETELELIAADTALQNQIAEELSDIQTELANAGERLAASEDILNRIQISAPVSGRVVELKFHTPGGIIGPGQAILDIVPEEEDLIVEARVSPMDVDVVNEGLEAQVHLSALAQRNLPQITGTVTHVSADRLVDPVTGQPYFKTTVEISRETLEALGDKVSLTSGMPAEVMIVTGEQTLIGYLFSPVRDTLRRSFREG